MIGVSIKWPTPKVIQSHIYLEAVKLQNTNNNNSNNNNSDEFLFVTIDANDGVLFPDFSLNNNDDGENDNIYNYYWRCQTSDHNDCNINNNNHYTDISNVFDNWNNNYRYFTFFIHSPQTVGFLITLTIKDNMMNQTYDNIEIYQIDPSLYENAFQIKIIQPICFNSNQRYILTAESNDLTSDEFKKLTFFWNVVKNNITNITKQTNIIQSKNELLLDGRKQSFTQNATYFINVVAVNQ